ncbi:MAG: molybdopterin-dependent oxidoreductase [Mycobacterium sp.]
MGRSADTGSMLAGIAAAAASLGVTQLLAAAVGPASDARTAVGSAVIDLTPGPVKEWAITLFGTADKLFLTVAVVAVIVAIAAVTAQWERSRVPVGSITITVAGLLGCAAVLSREGGGPLDTIPTIVGTVCGVAVLRYLTSIPSTDIADADTDAPADSGRRRSLVAFGVLAAGALAGVAGVTLGRQRSSVTADRATFALPRVAVPAPPIPAGVQPKDVAISSFVTSNDDFYRIDTALSVPQLAQKNWQLRIHGMVDREVTFTFADLARFEVIEKVVTLTCVSNPVGGNLISNATWTGYRVSELLAAAGIHPDADMVLSKSIDGFTAGTPVEALTDDRDSLLAISMNGEPLPVEHGYPARLVVPGLYGYVSATKWVVDLELTRFDRAEAYWTQLGWAARGPVKTQSRIDMPRSGQRFGVGRSRLGGVAWAQDRGVRAVEVQIDDGPWEQAQLGDSYADDTWRLWSYDWEAAEPGAHKVTVRATDNTGATQPSEQTSTLPDGATGWHSVSFAVE